MLIPHVKPGYFFYLTFGPSHTINISLFLQGDRGEPGLPGPPGTITDEHGVNIVGPPGPPVSIVNVSLP